MFIFSRFDNHVFDENATRAVCHHYKGSTSAFSSGVCELFEKFLSVLAYIHLIRLARVKMRRMGVVTISHDSDIWEVIRDKIQPPEAVSLVSCILISLAALLR